MVALQWYAKRAKLLAAFQRFTYQYFELEWAENGDWRGLANIFARRIAGYDFWDGTEMCVPIGYNSAGLKRFMETGQLGFFKEPSQIPEAFDEGEFKAHMKKLDVFELWPLLSLLPRTYRTSGANGSCRRPWGILRLRLRPMHSFLAPVFAGNVRG